jgi:D-alanyl-D-alanine carboxypeptidase/D-alanyl-D-alanine-endopeptidase (penicillin-binding protein 4)
MMPRFPRSISAIVLFLGLVPALTLVMGGVVGFGAARPEIMKEMMLPDAVGVTTLQNTPWEALQGDGDPQAEAIVRRYLETLKSQGLDVNKQGVWMQSGASMLVNHQGTTPLSVASLTKVATSLAALETWGAAHQFDTLVYATGPIQNGVLQGNLVIQGSGDPMFVWEEAIALGNTLNTLGIQQVTGELVITGNFFMNFDFDPMKSGEFLKQALNSKAWSGELSEQYAQLKPRPNKPTVIVNGNVRAIENLDLNAMNAKVIIKHQSLPLMHLIKRLNVYSNNIMAESLSRSIGGPQITAQRAASAAGISAQEISLVNGSGLGVENRISPHAVSQMFSAIARHAERNGFTVSDLFPISGTDVGTLIDRRIPKHAVIKTGTLNEVCALSGILPTRDRGLVWFSVVNYGSQIEGFRRQQDLLLQQLQAYWGTPKNRAFSITPTPKVNMPQSELGATRRNQVL